MTPDEAITELRSNAPRPVYLLSGDEPLFAQRVVAAARKHVVDATLAAFNLDVFEAAESSIGRVLDVANTLPMMAARRLVLLRGLERLDKGDLDDGVKDKVHPLDVLHTYVMSPSPSTCLLLVGKVDNRRRLALAAKKSGFLVECNPLKAGQLPGFIREECHVRGHVIGFEVASAIAELIGGELSSLLDACERLSLYVGKGQPIDEHAVHECVTRVRVSAVWGLSDAVLAGDRSGALRVLSENYDPRDRGIPLLALLASSVRKTLRFQVLLDDGESPDDAAKIAGIPPFRTRDTVTLIRNLAKGKLQRAVLALAEVDLALKGSRRAPDLVLEELVVRLT